MTKQYSTITHWRSQKLCVQGQTRAPEARGSRRLRRVHGVQSGEGCTLPSRLEGLGSVVSSLSGVRAKPRLQMHLLHILGHRTLLVERKI